MKADPEIAYVFSGFNKDLDSLEDTIKKQIFDISFSIRDGVHTTAVMFKSKAPVEQLIGFPLPKEITSLSSSKYGVDLTSIGTDKVRIYATGGSTGLIDLYGYYLNASGEIYYKKTYAKTPGKGGDDISYITISRYDGDGNLISDGELEIYGQGDLASKMWTGPAEIIDIAKKNGYETIFIKKTKKDQCYVRVVKSLE